MRGHLYQGKRLDNGEWVEGGLVQEESYGGKHKCYIVKSVPNVLLGGLIYDEVDPDTVREFTGLCDKNGKRIFEGDILIAQADDGEAGIILLCGIGECLDLGGEKVFGVYGEPTNGNGNRLIIPLSCKDFHYEVIGNKWDNPELLEGNV